MRVFVIGTGHRGWTGAVGDVRAIHIHQDAQPAARTTRAGVRHINGDFQRLSA